MINNKSKIETVDTTKSENQPQKKKTLKNIIIILSVILIALISCGVFVYAYLFSKFETTKETQQRIVAPPTSGMTIQGTEPVPVETEEVAEVVPYDKDLTNILIIGSDTRDMQHLESNADTMLLVTIDKKDNQVKLTSFQRDMLVYAPGTSQFNKINSFFYGGAQNLINVINYNFKLDISKYVVVNFDSMAKIIDMLGGVEADIPNDQKQIDYLNDVIDRLNKDLGEPHAAFIEKPGLQLLDGRQAVNFARIRKLDTDFERMKRQQALMSSAFHKAKGLGVFKLLEVVKEGLGLIKTDLSEMEILGLATSVFPSLKSELKVMSVPQSNFYTSAMIKKVYYSIPAINSILPELHNFIYGHTNFVTGDPVLEFDISNIPEDDPTESELDEDSENQPPFSLEELIQQMS